jgi:transposase-like protein
MHWITQEEKEKILARFREGATQREVAREFGRHVGTIRKVRKAAGVRLFPVITPELESQIVAAFRQGHGRQTTATMFGVSSQRVAAIAKKHGLKHKAGDPGLTRSDPALHKEIVASVKRREDFVVRLAGKYRVAPSTVSRIAHQTFGEGRLLGTWPPLESRISQSDARKFLSPQDVFQNIVTKCIDLAAFELLQRGQNREEVMAAKQSLHNDPSPILEKFDADLRGVLGTLRIEQMTASHVVH